MINTKWVPHLITVMGLLVFGFLGLACATSPFIPDAKLRKIVTKAANSASAELMKGLPKQGTIAVLGGDSSLDTTYAIEEIEYKLVNSGYRVADRQRLEKIRAEQQFQISGDVTDDTAVAIGRFAGTGAVIVVSVNSARLTVKALDVQTGRILAMARRDF